MLGHDDIGVHFEVIVLPGLFEGTFEKVSGYGCLEVGPPLETTDGDQVIVSHLLVTLQTGLHGRKCI